MAKGDTLDDRVDWSPAAIGGEEEEEDEDSDAPGWVANGETRHVGWQGELVPCDHRIYMPKDCQL